MLAERSVGHLEKTKGVVLGERKALKKVAVKVFVTGWPKVGL